MDIGDLRDADVAIVQGWFPGATGGTAVAETIFGEQNRFGKLPFTWYASNFTKLSDFDNMNMTDGPGRTYKYLKDPSLALWPAFHGLSYTTFAVSEPRAPAHLVAASASDRLGAAVTVTNTGEVAGDEVVFLFKKSDDAVVRWNTAGGGRGPGGGLSGAGDGPGDSPEPLPRRELIGYQRVTLAPGESTIVRFNVTALSLSSVDELGTRHVLPGRHTLIFGRGHGEELEQPVELQVDGGRRRIVVSTLRGLAGDGVPDSAFEE